MDGSPSLLATVNADLRKMSEAGFVRLWRYSPQGEKMPGWPAALGVEKLWRREPWAPVVTLLATSDCNGWLLEDEAGKLLIAVPLRLVREGETVTVYPLMSASF